MKRIGPRRALLALVLLAAPAVGLPAAGPDAAGLLRKAVARYADGAAHAASFTQTYRPAGFTTPRRESGAVWIQAPQRLRFDYAPPQSTVYTYDGGEGRFFSPEDRQLTVRRLTPDERARLPLVFLTDPAELAATYALAVEGTGDGSRLVLTPKSARPDLSWLRLAVAGDGTVSELSYEDGSGNRTTFQFASWRREKARPASDYRIAGRPGTRIVED